VSAILKLLGVKRWDLSGTPGLDVEELSLLKIFWDSRTMRFLGKKGVTSEGLGEVVKGDSADTCAGKFSLLSMGGPVKSAQTGSEDPHWHE
jgi:hypothetical protein